MNRSRLQIPAQKAIDFVVKLYDIGFSDCQSDVSKGGIMTQVGQIRKRLAMINGALEVSLRIPIAGDNEQYQRLLQQFEETKDFRLSEIYEISAEYTRIGSRNLYVFPQLFDEKSQTVYRYDGMDHHYKADIITSEDAGRLVQMSKFLEQATDFIETNDSAKKYLDALEIAKILDESAAKIKDYNGYRAVATSEFVWKRNQWLELSQKESRYLLSNIILNVAMGCVSDK